MCGHNCVDAGIERGAERDELEPVELLGRLIDQWQGQMRINVGIAVAGKVLADRDDARLLVGRDRRRAKRRHQHRVGAERARADHWVGRVAVDIQHRREIHIQADRAQFDCGQPRGARDERRIAGRAQRHLARPDGGTGRRAID
jgi:hypothetical protein